MVQNLKVAESIHILETFHLTLFKRIISNGLSRKVSEEKLREYEYFTFFNFDLPAHSVPSKIFVSA